MVDTKEYMVEFSIPVRLGVTFDVSTNPGVTWDDVTHDDAIANAIGCLDFIGLQKFFDYEGIEMLPVNMVSAKATLIGDET